MNGRPTAVSFVCGLGVLEVGVHVTGHPDANPSDTT
jgi:hypothetical protein